MAEEKLVWILIDSFEIVNTHSRKIGKYSLKATHPYAITIEFEYLPQE